MLLDNILDVIEDISRKFYSTISYLAFFFSRDNFNGIFFLKKNWSKTPLNFNLQIMNTKLFWKLFLYSFSITNIVFFLLLWISYNNKVWFLPVFSAFIPWYHLSYWVWFILILSIVYSLIFTYAENYYKKIKSWIKQILFIIFLILITIQISIIFWWILWRVLYMIDWWILFDSYTRFRYHIFTWIKDSLYFSWFIIGLSIPFNIIMLLLWVIFSKKIYKNYENQDNKNFYLWIISIFFVLFQIILTLFI